jgi:hypothetical protein
MPLLLADFFFRQKLGRRPFVMIVRFPPQLFESIAKLGRQ